MVIQVVDSRAIKTSTGEFESKSEDRVDSTNDQQPAPRKMTSVIATFSKATKKSQNVDGELLEKHDISIKTENTDSLTSEMENLKIKTEKVIDVKDEDECGDLLEKMIELKVNDDSPNVSTRKMVSVLKTRAKQKAKKSVEDEDEDDDNESEKDKKCKNEILNERGPTRNYGHRQNADPPYTRPIRCDASPMSESSCSSQDSPPYHPQYAAVYNYSDSSCSSSGSRFSPPLQQQIIKCVSQVRGNGGTCEVFNLEGQAADSNEPKASPPPKSLLLGSGGFVHCADNANIPWSEQNAPPPIYFLQYADSNCEREDLNTLSVPARSRQNSIGESLSPISSFCLSPASSQEPYSPASSVSGSVLSPNTINNLYNLELESGSNLISTSDEFGKSISSSLDSDAADELVASIQHDCFPDKDVDCWRVDFDATDTFSDIKSLEEDWNTAKNSSSIESANFTQQNQALATPAALSRSQSRSRSNSGRSLEERIQENFNKYPKILPKVSDSRTTERTTMNVPLLDNKSARDRLEARLNIEKKNHAISNAEKNDLRFYQNGDREGDTNLHIVFGKTFSDEEVFAVVEKFASNKAVLDIRNFIGQTPLFCAVARNDPLIVEYLLENGADPGYSCIDGITPMHCVAKRGDAYVEVARVLCSKCTPQQLNKKNKDGLTPLHYAVKFCQTKCVGIIEALLSNGAGLAGVEAQASKDGKSALHMAVEKSSLEMVSAICTSYKSVSSVIDHYTFSRDTALHLAARLNSSCNEDMQISIIRILMKHGAKSVKNKEGKFPKQLVPDKRPKVKKFLTSYKCNLIENF